MDVFGAAAAGNSSMNNDHFDLLLNYDVSGIISVAASDYNDKLAFFSNFGRKEVHVAAPGHKILSTVLGKRKYKFKEWNKYGGTSCDEDLRPCLLGQLVDLNEDQLS